MSGAESDRLPKILIADDDRHVVDIIARKCKQLGFHVETATNGTQAVLKAAKFKPDILVVDVHMPETSGFSIASHLVDPSRKSIEGVIAISGQFNPFETERWERLGATCVKKGRSFWVEFADALIYLYPSRANLLKQMYIFDAEVRKRNTILLVDDDRSTRDFLASRFVKRGVEPIAATNGVIAFNLAKREHPSVIITDYFMPNGDAEYLLNKLRTTPETKHIPVVVHTGRELAEHVQARLRREILGEPGAAHIVRKSHDAENLFDTLRNYCDFVTNSAAQPIYQRKILITDEDQQ
jgi:CheY-like chemotaxis protein